AVVFLNAHGGNPRAAVSKALDDGAAMVLVPEYPQVRERWQEYSGRWPKLGTSIVGTTVRAATQRNQVVVTKESAEIIESLAEGTILTLRAPATAPLTSHTRNVVGEIRGSDADLAHQAVLLSAHMDHIGVGTPVDGDDIYNGADDDASGVTAVLEL